jgi:hypothetical protein
MEVREAGHKDKKKGFFGGKYILLIIFTTSLILTIN